MRTEKLIQLCIYLTESLTVESQVCATDFNFHLDTEASHQEMKSACLTFSCTKEAFSSMINSANEVSPCGFGTFALNHQNDQSDASATDFAQSRR